MSEERYFSAVTPKSSSSIIIITIKTNINQNYILDLKHIDVKKKEIRKGRVPLEIDSIYYWSTAFSCLDRPSMCIHTYLICQTIH
jgi:hypothetical protein